MTEGLQVAEDAAAARAAEQARIRKERREAKIRAGGASRLDRISGLGGGIKRDAPPSGTSTPPAATTTTTTTTTSSIPNATAVPKPDHHGDPEEVDISQHYYEPRASPRPSDASGNISEAQLRQMMLGLDRGSAGTPPGRNPFLDGATPPPMSGTEGMEGDPMMQMLSKMMAGGGMPGMPGGGQGGANPFAGTPLDGLMGSLGGGIGGPTPEQQAQQLAANKTANLWRILHAVFALGLGLYVALSTTFTGTLTEREHSAILTTKDGGAEVDSLDRTRSYFFYVFTSVEALLLTSRYFLDTNREPPKGWLWTGSNFLPEPVKGYAQHALRYAQILGTVRSDALVCVFVLGLCSWWRS
ncbi:hypothetical protein GGR53DRAFT_244690 [Hypoxylon sp. FL1150]|nr:hypothetical protein GGR53DRAFT_244690 [Hypoxylon sp. FL1150]